MQLIGFDLPELELAILRRIQLALDGLLELGEDGLDVGQLLGLSFLQQPLHAVEVIVLARFEGRFQVVFNVGPEPPDVLLDALTSRRVEHRVQSGLRLADVHALEAPLTDRAACRDDLLVQPVAVPADDHQTRVRHYGDRVERMVGHAARRHAVQPLALFQGPHLGAQQPQRHLDEPVVQMSQHDIIASLRDPVVEGDRADLAGVRMFQPFRAARPAPL